MLNLTAAEALVRDRHAELRRAAARRVAIRRFPQYPAVRARMGWMLVRTGWRLAASGRRSTLTICGRTTLL